MFHVSPATPIRLLCAPYTVTLPLDTPAVEYAFIDLQRNTDQPSDVVLLASAADGGLTAVPMTTAGEDEEVTNDKRLQADLKAVWDAGLQEVDEHGPEVGLPGEGLDKRPAARSTYDARWAWEGTFAFPC